MTIELIAYEEGVRLLSQQEETLAGLHTRASVLFSSSAIATAFLSQLGNRGPQSPALAIPAKGLIAFAVTMFVGVLASAIFILWPRTWKFGRGPADIVTSYIDTPNDDGSRMTLDETLRDLACHMDNNHRDNAKQLGCMFIALELGLLALGAEVIAWVASKAL